MPRKTPDLQTALGYVIRARRLDLYLSQEGLSTESGIHRTIIGEFEYGRRNMSLTTLSRIATALRVTPSWLVKEAEDGLKNHAYKVIEGGVQFGRPHKMTEERLKLAKKLLKQGESIRYAADVIGVHVSTLYLHLRT